nr:bifunctional nicotinamidase/pyrazinamidase [uncultured Gellertiella sp.]
MRALLLVDLQNGFCTGGQLPVPGGDEVIAVANRLMRDGGYDLIVASQDWHPENHGSFASQHPGKAPFDMGELKGAPQMLWPDHCVEGTDDAAFHPSLEQERIQFVQRKGQDVEVDSYSAFRDNDRSAFTGLAQVLKEKGVTALDIGGLATDYCVLYSALDARELLPGTTIRFVSDLSRGITAEGTAAALDAMKKAVIAVVTSDGIISRG